jgi:hypothetical protein
VIVPPPLIIAAIAVLALTQIVGLLGLRAKLNLTTSLAMLVLLGIALGLGLLGLQFLVV